MRVLLLMLVLVHGISSAYGQPQQQPAKAASPTKKEIAGSKGNPLFIQRNKSPEEKAEEDKQADDAKENLDMQRKTLKASENALVANQETLKETRRAALAAIIAAAVALVMMAIAAYQVRMFRRQLDSMDAAEKRAEVEAKDRARDTGSQLKISEGAANAALMQATYLQQSTRAYVLPSGEDVMNHNGRKVKVTIRFKNYGRTPAKSVRVSLHMNSYKMPYTGPFEGPTFENASTSTIGPDGVFTQIMEVPTPVPEPEFKGICNGDGGMFLWGDIAYEDIFGVEQRTSFRRISTGKDFEQCLMLVCAEGNECT